MTRQEEADIALLKWQESDSGRAERNLHDLAVLVDDLANCASTRDGFKSLRSDYKRLRETSQKLFDLRIQVAPFYKL